MCFTNLFRKWFRIEGKGRRIRTSRAIWPFKVNQIRCVFMDGTRFNRQLSLRMPNNQRPNTRSPIDRVSSS
jgi:hypothetical protein